MLDGLTTVDAFGPWTSGCWRQLSTCSTQGMSVAFFLKVISGVANHGELAGLISANRDSSKEGWGIFLYNWSGTRLIRIFVRDMQVPTKKFTKEIINNFVMGQWYHFVVNYKFTDPNDADAQFKVYENGLLAGNLAHGSSYTSTADAVDQLALGRTYLKYNSGETYAYAVLDELLIFDGVIDSSMALALYNHY